MLLLYKYKDREIYIMKKFKVTQADINKYVANGGDLCYLSSEQKEAIPQKNINQYVVNGGCIDDNLTEENK